MTQNKTTTKHIVDQYVTKKGILAVVQDCIERQAAPQNYGVTVRGNNVEIKRVDGLTSGILFGTMVRDMRRAGLELGSVCVEGGCLVAKFTVKEWETLRVVLSEMIQ